MEELTFDVSLLRKAVEWAEAEAARPDVTQCQWYQGDWMSNADDWGRDCGTCYCLAGYVAFLTLDPDVLRRAPNQAALISDTAKFALGITEGEANGTIDDTGLFAASNDISDVRAVAERIARRHGEEL